MSLFSAVQLAPRDPILGLTEQYNDDPNPAKVNLGVGVYTGEDGKIPVLECVANAQKQLLETPKPKGYLPIDGLPAYNQAVKHLVFGAESDLVQSGRVATIQGLGGTGALKVGADFLFSQFPQATVMASAPTWGNHRSIFGNAGFQVAAYPYYDAQNRQVDFNGMTDALKLAKAGTIVILHACCHNPSGYDLTPDQWDQVIDLMKNNGLIPFLDMAYQGFANGLTEDGLAARKFADSGMSFLLSSSFSKTFSLYGERVGALSVICANKDETQRVLSQIKVLIRTNYSNPPSFGAQIVSTVLGDVQLRQQWEQEINQMRERIKTLRRNLVTKLKEAGVKQDVNFITTQNGMFSYSGLSKDQMLRLRSEFSIYGTDDGRICVACINTKNIDYIANSFAAVM